MMSMSGIASNSVTAACASPPFDPFGLLSQPLPPHWRPDVSSDGPLARQGGWLEDIQDPAAEVEPDLRQEGRRIRDLLAKRLGMDLAADELSAGDQGDEYAPVIVET
mmetsp:Transcript_19296/g.45994  ORF Transcript_19296/g.45994 Transcript_19296/m.45994 type:complete len:107 (-) Transcript_19296:67-387(-)